MALDLKTLSLTPAQLRTATPVEIDERIYKATRELNTVTERVMHDQRIRDALNDSRQTNPLYWTDWSAARLAETEAKIEAAGRRCAALRTFLAPLHQEHDRRGGWTRAHLSITNGRGHVHRTTECHTLYRDEYGNVTTRLDLVWRYSGADEAEIVGDAGERACTVCYPSAPVDILKRPTRIFSEEEEARLAARAERETKRAAKADAAAVKGITNPDGTPLMLSSHHEAKTVRTAEISYTDDAAYLMAVQEGWYPYPGRVGEASRDVELVLAALAAKFGTTVAEQRERLAPKVIKKAKGYK